MYLLRCGIRIWFFSADQRCYRPGSCGNLDLSSFTELHSVLKKSRQLSKPIRRKRRQLFIRAHNKAPIFVPMRVSNEDRSTVGIHW